MAEQFPGHIRPNGEQDVVQSVQSHCRNTAEIAQNTLSGIHLGFSAYLAGLLHDAGKFTEAFRSYLIQSVHGEKTPHRPVHTFTGVRYLLQQYHMPKDEDDFGPIAAELLAFAVGAHHGLFDCVDEHGNSGFQHRLDKPDIDFEEAMGNFLAQCADKQELDRLFDEAAQELTPVFHTVCDLAQQDDSYNGEVSFYLGLLARLLLSAVIEGDRRDTAAFLNGFVFPEPAEDCRPIWNNCLARMEQKLGEFTSDSPISRARQTISDRCRSSAEQPGGVFRLNVPTGGGKTLSSLRYALAHAARWEQIPYYFHRSAALDFGSERPGPAQLYSR